MVLGLASTALELARMPRVYSSSDFNAYGRNPEKVRVRVVETIGDTKLKQPQDSQKVPKAFNLSTRALPTYLGHLAFKQQTPDKP